MIDAHRWIARGRFDHRIAVFYSLFSNTIEQNRKDDRLEIFLLRSRRSEGVVWAPRLSDNTEFSKKIPDFFLCEAQSHNLKKNQSSFLFWEVV